MGPNEYVARVSPVRAPDTGLAERTLSLPSALVPAPQTAKTCSNKSDLITGDQQQPAQAMGFTFGVPPSAATSQAASPPIAIPSAPAPADAPQDNSLVRQLASIC
jgi:hypothetical protein